MRMKYNPGQQRVEAIYSKVQNPLHQGNPLIEALPEIKSKETLAAGLRMEIPFSEEQLQYPPEVRADLVGALNHYFAPWELHLALAQEIRSAICDGYVNRNPLEKAFQESIRQVRAAVQEKDAEFHSCTFSRNNPISSSFSIIGYSGMGKSSSVRNILAQIPQVIRHGTYRGEPFAETQVVWLNIECPHDGSVKGLCHAFLEEFDHLTHGNTALKYGMGTRATTNQMIAQTAMLARRYHLGVLVIDEIQDISVAKGKTQQEIIQFLIQLVNSIQIPIILIGTPPAVQVLQSDTKLGGRFPIKCYFDLLREDQVEWKILCKSLMGHQWTANRTQLTKELAHEIYVASCGVTATAVMMVIKAQREAIRWGGEERITPQLIRELADMPDFRLFRQKMAAIQNMDMAMQISGDCATLGWNRSMKQLDVKDVLPCRNTQDSIISNGQDQQKAEDALQPVIDEKTPQLKKRKPRLEKKKKETIEDGYQKLKEEGYIANLDEDLA